MFRNLLPPSRASTLPPAFLVSASTPPAKRRHFSAISSWLPNTFISYMASGFCIRRFRSSSLRSEAVVSRIRAWSRLVAWKFRASMGTASRKMPAPIQGDTEA